MCIRAAAFHEIAETLYDDAAAQHVREGCDALAILVGRLEWFREMIADELTSDVSPTNWEKIEGIAIAMQDLAYYIATDDWTNALKEINDYV